MTTDDNKQQRAKMKPEDTIWVICTSPVTLLLPTSERRLPTNGGDPTKAQEPLKLERGLNVLVGPVNVEGGGTKYITLDGLPASLQQRPPEERGQAAREMFERARKLYEPMFKGVGDLPARIVAHGTMAELVREHFAALLTAATNGTHKPSLEALILHPGVQEHVKDLARTRLAAWRPAA